MTTRSLAVLLLLFWQSINWSLVGVLFIVGYCTLLAVVILVVKKTKPPLSELPESQVAESLHVLFPDGQSKTFPMPEERMSIGRHASNTLMLIDSKVSSHHAEILAKPEGYVIKDLGSTNGVFVNGKRVTKRTLQPGDVVKIGLTTITVD
jgi:hypothetical protein